MSKIEKEMIAKAAAKYIHNEGDKPQLDPRYIAFKAGIAWYKKNREKIGEAEAMDAGYNILKSDL